MEVKNKKKTLFGFGHRVYKNYDPRAKIVKKVTFFLTLDCFRSLWNLRKRAINRDRFGAWKDRPGRWVLCYKKIVSKRWLLQWPDLQSNGIPNWHVPSTVHNSKSCWMDFPLGWVLEWQWKQHLQTKTKLCWLWKERVHRNVRKKEPQFWYRGSRIKEEQEKRSIAKNRLI